MLQEYALPKDRKSCLNEEASLPFEIDISALKAKTPISTKEVSMFMLTIDKHFEID